MNGADFKFTQITSFNIYNQQTRWVCKMSQGRVFVTGRQLLTDCNVTKLGKITRIFYDSSHLPIKHYTYCCFMFRRSALFSIRCVLFHKQDLLLQILSVSGSYLYLSSQKSQKIKCTVIHLPFAVAPNSKMKCYAYSLRA